MAPRSHRGRSGCSQPCLPLHPSPFLPLPSFSFYFKSMNNCECLLCARHRMEPFFLSSFLFLMSSSSFSFIHPTNTYLGALIFHIPRQKLGVQRGSQESQPPLREKDRQLQNCDEGCRRGGTWSHEDRGKALNPRWVRGKGCFPVVRRLEHGEIVEGVTWSLEMRQERWTAFHVSRCEGLRAPCQEV